MQRLCRLSIDGNDVTFEVAQVQREFADHHEIDPSCPVLKVTTIRDGKIIWSGFSTWNVEYGAPATAQLTAEQLTEIYRQARYRWLKRQALRPSP